MATLREILIDPINPADDVVSVQEVKDHCNIDYDIDDTLITGYIATARIALEQFTGRVFLKSNCKAIWEGLGLSKEYVYRLCFNDNIELADGSKYEVNAAGDIVTSDRVVVIEYTAGYESEDMPQIVKDAVMKHVADQVENRGEERQDKTVGRDAKLLIASFIKSSFFF